MPFELTSPAFRDRQKIPSLHSCEGADLSPSLEWTDPPKGTHSFALIMEDPDAPNGTWNHWLVWDIPETFRHLAQGFRPGIGVSGNNDFKRSGYGGPCPPKGDEEHRYFFRLMAVDVPSLGLEAGATRKQLEGALAGHTLGEAVLVGLYERF